MLPPHGLVFLISSKSVLLYASVIHITAFVTPAMEHWLEREIGQWVHHEGSIRSSYHGATSRSLVLTYTFLAVVFNTATYDVATIAD